MATNDDLKPRLLSERAKIEQALKFHDRQIIACTAALQVIDTVLAEPPAAHPPATPNGA